MRTRNFESFIIILLVLQSVISLFYQVWDYILVDPVKFFKFNSLFNNVRQLVFLILISAHISLVIGIFQCLFKRKFRLNNFLRFSLYLFLTTTAFSVLNKNLATNILHSLDEQLSSLWFYVFAIVKYLLLGLTILHFSWNKNLNLKLETKKVTAIHRFINWVIDYTIIVLLTMLCAYNLRNGHILDHIGIFDSNPLWLFVIHTFIYYLIQETFFLQTIGKLHNSSYVAIKNTKTRFEVIFIRTCSRLIPFNAFSFLGKKGWHDLISETSVVKNL